MKKNIVEVKIGFNINTEEIEYIKSDFMNKDSGYNDPIEYTAKLISMGLEEWVRKYIGFNCPDCDTELEKDWFYCPNCGWNDEK